MDIYFVYFDFLTPTSGLQITLVPSKAMVRRLRWHRVLKVATTLVIMISSASSLLESMRKCVVQQEDHRGFLFTHLSSTPPSPPFHGQTRRQDELERGKGPRFGIIYYYQEFCQFMQTIFFHIDDFVFVFTQAPILCPIPLYPISKMPLFGLLSLVTSAPIIACKYSKDMNKNGVRGFTFSPWLQQFFSYVVPFFLRYGNGFKTQIAQTSANN